MGNHLDTLQRQSGDEVADSPVRALTQDEIDHYFEHGWARLAGFVDPDLCRQIARAGAQLPADTAISAAVDAAYSQVLDAAHRSPVVRRLALDPGLGAGLSRLLHTKRVRLQQSNFTIKNPTSRSDAHGRTPYHQDIPFMPIDRSEMLTVWIPLVPVTAAMGPLRFIDRSHQLGSLGRSFLHEGDDTPGQHPWLEQWTLTEAIDMAVGDATVHGALTVHGAPENAGQRARVVITLAYFAADTLYTGAPFARTDGLGLAVNEPFDHPKFPLIPLPGERAEPPFDPPDGLDAATVRVAG